MKAPIHIIVNVCGIGLATSVLLGLAGLTFGSATAWRGALYVFLATLVVSFSPLVFSVLWLIWESISSHKVKEADDSK